MHYIRLLRRPTLDAQDRNNATLSLLITITTDLGDSFLNAGTPVPLVLCYSDDSIRGKAPGKLVAPDKLLRAEEGRPILWRDGTRVLKIKVHFPKFGLGGKAYVDVEVQPDTGFSFKRSHDVLPGNFSTMRGRGVGCIMPLRLEIQDGVPSDISIRQFELIHHRKTAGMSISVGEDVGESIARHIWDAGVVAASFLAFSCETKIPEYGISRFFPLASGSPSILELGSGVGILGLAIGTLLVRAADVQGRTLDEPFVLLTDLPEAEERAMSNISRYNDSQINGIPKARVEYENLDWEDARRGKFGTIAGSRSWDYVVLSDCTYNVDSLPLLVGALTALHAVNQRYSTAGDGATTSKVILATKPRHDSELALFELLGSDGWEHNLLTSLPLPRLGEEEEVVEIYLLQKGSGNSTACV
jgi:hypothetical protein